MSAAALIAQLRAQRSPRDIEGQRRFGITPRGEHLGVRTETLRALAKPHRRDHPLALALWASGIFEARTLAFLIDDPKQVTVAQMEAWAADFDNWATVDGCCIHLFRKTPFARAQADAWSQRPEEYIKRAGFTLMATLAVHAKDFPDAVFLDWLPVIARAADDERNFVKKAVNWALRQIGKRNPALRRAALATARELVKRDSRAARWIARDAIRELQAHANK
ncbi:MAG: DNA alkylation repair protein [Opitutae bacterium]|nr:DNA alkylation repair protein [Opitutae bacterium]